jgi:hypothetical protein
VAAVLRRDAALIACHEAVLQGECRLSGYLCGTDLVSSIQASDLVGCLLLLYAKMINPYSKYSVFWFGENIF